MEILNTYAGNLVRLEDSLRFRFELITRCEVEISDAVFDILAQRDTVGEGGTIWLNGEPLQRIKLRLDIA